MKTRLQSIHPRLPMQDLEATKQFYTQKLGFEVIATYGADYLIVSKDQVEIHFFRFDDLSIADNYGMCYIRVNGIDQLYAEVLSHQASLAQLGALEEKPWQQKEFSVVDVNGNLLTFGEVIPVGAVHP